MGKKDKVFIIIACILFFTLLLSGGTSVYYKNKYDRLVEQNRVELELLRNRTEQYENTYRQARETNSELGKCLSKSVTTLSELRHQISEVRARFEKMESLLNSVGLNDNNVWTYDSSSDTTDEGQISEE